MKHVLLSGIVLAALCIVACNTTPSAIHAEDRIPVSAPLLTDSSGRTGNIAVDAVFRIRCSSSARMGTGFLHSSGNVLTAAHVVAGSNPKDLLIVTAKGRKVEVAKVEKDQHLDIAILYPKKKIKAKALPISRKDAWPVGAQVSTWGYPAGYNGGNPMLSVGWLSGKDVVKSPTGKPVSRFVVNAAFNAGNSGGPLIDIETGEVIGIVASKLAPLPPYIESALKALRETKSGVTFTKTKPDGTKEQMVEAQVLEDVLQYLRSQTQLVVGRAVLPGDIQAFLKKHKLVK